MTTQQQLEDDNAALRNAVETRLAGRTTAEVGGMVASLHGCKPALEAAAAVLADPPERTRVFNSDGSECQPRQTGDGVLADGDPYSEWVPPASRREEAIAGFKRVVEDWGPASEARELNKAFLRGESNSRLVPLRDSPGHEEWKKQEAEDMEDILWDKQGVHPSSRAFYRLCDSLKAMHRAKSIDYGSEHDPLANIRNGAEFVGIEPWRAAMVRLSDKVTRLATYNRTGTLLHEGVDDTLLDLASYALLCLVLHQEGRDVRV